MKRFSTKEKQGKEVLNRKLIEAGFAWVYEQYCKTSECQ